MLFKEKAVGCERGGSLIFIHPGVGVNEFRTVDRYSSCPLYSVVCPEQTRSACELWRE